MSVKATERAWESSASGNDLLVLLALADHAGGEDDPYGHAYPAVERLGRMTRLSRRTVQRALRTLEEQGYIRCTGSHAWGRGKATNVYTIEPGPAPEEGGRQDDAASPDVPEGASPVTPNPSRGTVHPPAAGGRGRAQADPDELPADFPAELTPALDEVVKTLGHVVEVRGGRPVARAAVARAMVKRPRKPHAAVAERVEHWLLYGKGSMRPTSDVVARWRDWCDDEADVIAGRPEVAAALAGGGGVVRPLRRHGRSTMADYQALKGTIG